VKTENLPTGSELQISSANSKDFESGFGFSKADQSQLEFEKELLSGDGSAKQPFQYTLTIHNPTEEQWKGIVKIDLVSPSLDADFFLPGFLYGHNQGKVEVDPRVDKQHPRLRKGVTDMPYSPYWFTRSDQLTHPVAILYDNENMYAISVSPYFTKSKTLWRPTNKGQLLQWNGFSCSVEHNAMIGITLGYSYAPVLYETPWITIPKKNEANGCISLKAGEKMDIEFTVYAFPSKRIHDLNQIIRNLYEAYHELPRMDNTSQQTASDIAHAIAENAYGRDQKTYALIEASLEGYKPGYEGLISWTNGTVIAYPLLMAAHRLNHEDYRAQVLDVIDNIVDNSVNPKSGLPYTVSIDNEWSNRGWWWREHTSRAGWEPDHPSYLVGQALYYILKAYQFEKEKNGVEHEKWLDFVKSTLDNIQTTINHEHAFPQFWSEKDGKGYFYDAFSGCWCVAAMAYYTQVTNDTVFMQTAIECEKFYYKAVAKMECTKTPLDVWDSPDSEGVLAYIRAVKVLYELTNDENYLTRMKMGLDYELSFIFAYNVPISGHPLDTIAFSTSGGAITSVCNAVIHCMTNSIIDEMDFYYNETQDSYYKDRLNDTYLWGLQAYNRKDKEFSFGKKGWSTEYFAQAERYVLQTRFPDGSWSNVWQAYHPWATASILEGICGELWDSDYQIINSQ